MTIERRKLTRLKVQSGVLAVLSRSPPVLGQIIEITEDGLSFRYVASQKRSEESPYLNIFVRHKNFISKALPYKTVWDLPAPDLFSKGTITIRRCGVQFGNLKDDEKADIDFVIQNYSTADTED